VAWGRCRKLLIRAQSNTLIRSAHTSLVGTLDEAFEALAELGERWLGRDVRGLGKLSEPLERVACEIARSAD
jgi:hypothetical protein